MLRTALFFLFFSGCAAIPAAAQNPNSSDPQTPAAGALADPAAPADAKKPKKVWTNENLSSASGTISVVGDPKNASKGKAGGDKPADPKYISEVKKQLEKLQTDISDIDKQLVDLKNFSKGEPSSSSSGIQLRKNYDRDPVEVQIRELQEKKTELQSKIDALLDEARKKNVEPGQLR